MIQSLVAVRFEKFMTSGRTRPALLSCEDADGKAAGEYVVKMRGCIDTGTTGLTCEVIASLLARHFRIRVPEPGIVRLDQEFLAAVLAVRPDAVCVGNSVGLGFGTRLLTEAAIWPIDKSIPESLFKQATRIFAFDALIENHDRRYDHPNLFVRNDDLFAFDHEGAFSFVFPLQPPHPAWDPAGNRFPEDHVFYRQLKGHKIDFDEFAADLETLTDAEIDRIAAAVPVEWRNENLGKITTHLRLAHKHAWPIADQLCRRLA